MSRTPDKPPPRYTLADASRAVQEIHSLRRNAGDPDLDGLSRSVVDDLDVAAAVSYVEQHRSVSPSARAAELPARALLIEYLHQRALEAHENRLLRLLQAGHHLGARAAAYGAPLGIPSRQAVYDRRVRLARKYPTSENRVDEGRARQWLDDHSGQIRSIADCLVDNRDSLAELMSAGPARAEVITCIDTAGSLMTSRRVSQDLCTAVALALHLLKPEALESAVDPDVRDQINAGRRLLW
jgi:hypothetical protein